MMDGMKTSEIKVLVIETFKDWSEDKASRLAAALSYYTVFSLPPLLIILLAIAGRFFDDAEVRLTNQIVGLVGETGGEAITAILENASRPQDSAVAIVIGVVTLLLGASGVFGQLQEAMNTIWEVPPDPKGGIIETIKDRFFSFTMVFGVGFLLLVSLVISAGLSTLDEYVNNLLPSFVIVAQILNIVVSLIIITLMFALIFKVIPDVAVSWHDVWIGAFVTAVLFTAGKWAISFYLSKSAPASSYGAAGSLIVILLWIYYSTQILFLGAEFTQVYANKFGSKIVADWATPEAAQTATASPAAAAVTSSPRTVPNLRSNRARASQFEHAHPLPEPVKPVARLVKQFHHILVSVLAVPAAIVRPGRGR